MLLSKHCHYENCSTRPSYGELYRKKKHCSKHRKNNEYINNNPKCEEIGCKEMPCYTDTKENYPKRCENHEKKGDRNVVEKKCKNCGLSFYLNDECLCNDCHEYINHIVKERKEKQVNKIVLKKFRKPTSIDIIPKNSCFKYRPDMVWDFGTHIAILEIDENQHKTYECLCEQSRMVNITQDFGSLPVVWVRFNPDMFVDNNGVKHSANINNRMENVVSVLKMCENHVPVYLCSVVYLYYDGFNCKNIHIDVVDLSSLGL